MQEETVMMRQGIFSAGRSFVGALLGMALAFSLALLLASALPASADYVSGLNPRGDNYLSLRNGPGSGYGEILRMGPDTVVTVLERRGDWRRVRLENGITGWAFGRYIRAGLPPGYQPIPEPQAEFGQNWAKWRDAVAGTAVDYPTDLFAPAADSGAGGVTFSASSIDAMMEIQTLSNADGLDASSLRRVVLQPGERVTYSSPIPSGLVVSGVHGDSIFYRKALLSADGSTITLLDLSYPAELKLSFDDIVSRISRTLTAAQSLPGSDVAGAGQQPEPGSSQTPAAAATGSNGDAELERLKLQAEIERLQVEKLKLTQQAGGTPTVQAPSANPTPPAAAAPQGRLVALVIGNGEYASLTQLSTPAADATAIAQRLAQLGYDVALGINQNRQQMAELLSGFYTKAQGAGVALFYYSGHGMQIEGRNYLLPTDAAFANEASFLDADAHAFDLQKFVTVSSTARISVVFIDACRDDPLLEKSIVSSLFKGATGSVAKGLAVVQRENLNSGQFVGFAAEPGKTAETGTGEISVYTEALLKELQTPGLDVSIMHRRVRSNVEAATNGRQSPRYVDDLADQFALNPGS
jgi:hypothetical protein